MTTTEKAKELIKDLGVEHAIYVTDEILTILKDWEATELAQKDWEEIKEIIEQNNKKDTPEYLVKEKHENNLDNAKKYLIETNFEFFTQIEQNVIGKTMVAYAKYVKAE